MSGITGIYNLDGRPAQRAVLEQMLASIKHRGPDGEGVWCGESIGLAQCMRWSTIEALRERQPILSSRADLVLVADARIDNREELISGLQLMGNPAEQITDAQLILKAYQAWGDACPDKLEGDFAFVLWDSKQQLLFCARDAAGAKPFYYHLTPRLFAFASEIKALLVLQEVPKRLNEDSLADFLLGSFDQTDNTFFQDIRRLPPACTLTVKAEGVQRRQYWKLDPSREIRFNDEKEYILAFREKFGQSVRSRMRSVRPLGTTLSGGLDSSSIACVARNHLQTNGPLNTFSLIFPQESSGEWSNQDERNYIDKVLAMGGFEPHYIDGNSMNPLIEPKQLYSVLDEPYFAPTLYLFWNLFQHVGNSGVRVLLDGTDGDRTVSHGIDHLADLTRSGRWLTLWREASAYKEFGQESLNAASLAWKYGLRSLVPPAMIEYKRRLLGRKDVSANQQLLIRRDFANRMGYDVKSLSNGYKTREITVNARYKHWQTLVSGVNALSLELFDKVSAAQNIEVRYPFYDRRLMEFCLALPAEQKFNHGRTRYILRAAMEGIIPPDIQRRATKANLAAVFSGQLNLSAGENLKLKVEESSKILGAYIDPDVLRNIFVRYCADPLRRIGDAYTIFEVIILADWLQYASLG